MPLVPEIVAVVESSKYFLVFIGSFFEGTIVMMASGVLWKLGSLEFWPMYAALVAGDFIADLVWYAVGYFGARPFIMRWGHYLGASPPVVAHIEERFRVHQTKILIVSKLTTGFGFALATLITAGMLRVSLKLYLAIQFLGGLVWVLMMVLAGYYFGDVFRLIPPQFQLALGIALLIGLFLGLRAVNRRVARLTA